MERVRGLVTMTPRAAPAPLMLDVSIDAVQLGIAW